MRTAFTKFLIFSACILLLHLAGCSRSSNSNPGSPLPANPGGTPTDPFPNFPFIALEGPVRDLNCLANELSSLCLFGKSPQEAKGSALADTRADSAELPALLTARVELKNVNSSLGLDSGRAFVSDIQHTLVGPNNTNSRPWLLPYSAETKDRLAAATAFYWWNLGTQLLSESAGSAYTASRRVRIIVGDKFSGWSGPSSTLHLSARSPNLSDAFDAGIILYYLGVAEAWFAGSGQAFAFTNSQHQACAMSDGIARSGACCKSAAGCSAAIISASGDFTSFVVLAEKASLGEIRANSLSGALRCGRRRSALSNDDLTKTIAFSACSSESRSGDSIVMGLVYSSIWKSIRTRAKTQNATFAKNIDRIFSKHLELINAEDTFDTALDKILVIDGIEFSGAYNLLIREEFSARGIGVL